MSGGFISVAYGMERLRGGVRLPRHRHVQPYAAVVLSGSYLEAGDEGRWRVGEGDVLIHGTFDAHRNDIHRNGCRLLNLPLPPDCTLGGAIRIGDPDRLAALAERSLAAAVAALLCESWKTISPARDWPDQLSAELRSGALFRLDEWVRRMGLAPATVSRGFAQAYGTTPIRYRLELRVKRALSMIRSGGPSLASIACECGFADQSHMTRAVSRLTGLPPSAWRRSNAFKTRSRGSA